ncbi:MAG TPA: hypothetical protein PKD64_18430 [Pirellulaceae bacterium]|nr:hypothetical protein [Pirellulaceae bacterium]HMO94167.1 hypothetical protein [Pirellulaceae bacterium]HMP71294.1 hypothetical protein [Pirellulaceae bacterium]
MSQFLSLLSSRQQLPSSQALPYRVFIARTFPAGIVLSALLLFFSNISQAQLIVGRDSHLNFNYVFGAGGSVYSDTQILNAMTQDLNDNLAIGHSQMEGGSNPPGPWTAGIDVELAQQYSITGSLGNFSQIQASGFSTGETFSTGFGSVGLHSSSPGNRLMLYFDVIQPQDYSLTGEIAFTGTSPGAQNQVALQLWDGIIWANVHNSLFLPGSQGSFDWTGTLNPGEYRMLSVLGLSLPGGNQSAFRSYNYDFQLTSIPEPSSAAAVLMIGVVSVLIRRRR